MEKIFITIAIVISCISAYSQNYKLETTFSPISLMEPTHPNIRGGIEFYPLKNLNIGIDAGFGTTINYKISLLTSHNMKKYNYFQFRPNLKVILYSNSDMKFYLGIEYFYMQEQDILKNDYYNIFGQEAGKISFSEANYFRNKEGLQLLLGIKVYGNKRFFMDMYAGGGIARKYAYFDNVKNPVYQVSYDYLFSSGLFCGYSDIIPHLAVNFKIGWRLFKEIQTTTNEIENLLN